MGSVPDEIRKCDWCSGEFKPVRKGQRFCQIQMPRCKDLWFREEKRVAVVEFRKGQK